MADPYARLRAAIARFTRSAGGGGGGSTSGGVPAGFLRVTIVDDVNGNRKGIDRLFDAFDATIDDIPDVFRESLPAIRAAHRAVFASEGASGRGRWTPLAPSTLAERARLGYGPGPIHVRTGALRDHVLSAPAQITRFAGGVELRIEPDANVGGVPKYRALALGTDRIPSRPMVALGRPAAARVTSTIQRALRNRARSHGLG